MQKFKIGQLSSFVDVPVETIRYLEQIGLLEPEKSSSSGYRYYSIFDANKIIDYKRFREAGFSSKEAVDLVVGANLEQVRDSFDKKIKEVRREALLAEAKARRLMDIETLTSNAPNMVGKYLIVNSPVNYTLFLRTVEAGKLSVLPATETESYRNLSEYLMFMNPIMVIKKDWLDFEGEENYSLWGLSIWKKWTDFLEIPIGPEMVLLPASPALYTVIKTRPEEYFSRHHFKNALTYIKDHDLRMAGDIAAVNLGTSLEGGEAVRYLELWIPLLGLDSHVLQDFYK